MLTVAIISIAVIISLTYIIFIISSVSSLLVFQKQEPSVTILTIVYPILDAILLMPAVLILWIRRKPVTLEHKSLRVEQQDNISWILLSLSMILFAIADSGFAYTTALNLMTAQKELWIWDIFYTSFGLCLAAALIGYRSFFSFNKIDTLQH